MVRKMDMEIAQSPRIAEGGNLRKALDQVVLVCDLAALVLGVLLGGSNLLRGSIVLAGNLYRRRGSQFVQLASYGRRGFVRTGVDAGRGQSRVREGSTYNVARHFGWCCVKETCRRSYLSLLKFTGMSKQTELSG